MTQQSTATLQRPAFAENHATGESFKTRLMRWAFNWLPAYRRTGAQITYIARDFCEVRVKLPLNWKTRNFVGTLFGGSIFGAVDGIHLVMLIKLLGSDYVVWDKASTVRFMQPGRTTLYARVAIDELQLKSIRAELIDRPKLDRVFEIQLTDCSGVVHASIEKTIHIRRKAPQPDTPGMDETAVAVIPATKR